MVEVLYARFRDYRGYLLETRRTPFLGRMRVTVWKGSQSLKVFGSMAQAEAFIDQRREGEV